MLHIGANTRSQVSQKEYQQDTLETVIEASLKLEQTPMARETIHNVIHFYWETILQQIHSHTFRFKTDSKN